MNRIENQINSAESSVSLGHEKNGLLKKMTLDVYREMEDSPNQSLDLMTQLQHQMDTLKDIHSRKMFLMKEIKSVIGRS